MNCSKLEISHSIRMNSSLDGYDNNNAREDHACKTVTAL